MTTLHRSLPHRPPRRTLVALTAAAALALAGCGGSSASDTTDGKPPSPATKASALATQAAATIKVTIKGNDIAPVAEPLKIGVGQTVSVDVTSDRAGTLHVHSTPEHEYNFNPGTSHFEFTLDQPGQVDIEEHVSDTLIARVTVQ